MDISIKYNIRSAKNRYIYKVQETCCIVHVFAGAKRFKFYQMTSYCVSYC